MSTKLVMKVPVKFIETIGTFKKDSKAELQIFLSGTAYIISDKDAMDATNKLRYIERLDSIKMETIDPNTLDEESKAKIHNMLIYYTENISKSKDSRKPVPYTIQSYIKNCTEDELDQFDILIQQRREDYGFMEDARDYAAFFGLSDSAVYMDLIKRLHAELPGLRRIDELFCNEAKIHCLLGNTIDPDEANKMLEDLKDQGYGISWIDYQSKTTYDAVRKFEEKNGILSNSFQD